jgi:ubiquinone/menaquinone biosynthesis C-methylase UbiE
MKIHYKETTDDLATRIQIHSKYGGKDIDQWMLDILDLKPNLRILDVGSGAGKQCFSYYAYLHGQAEITGGDVNKSLLDQARSENITRRTGIKFIDLDFNKKFPFENDQFDLVSCCFAIYYAENVPFTIKEMHRVLKAGGRLFTTGPMPDNKKMFYDIIKEATGKPIPPMPGSSRYSSEFLSTIKSLFRKVDVLIFENPLKFDHVDPFIAYTRASLSEDRKLWTSFFKDHSEYETVIERIQKVAEKWLARDGNLTMTKVVGGFLAVK